MVPTCQWVGKEAYSFLGFAFHVPKPMSHVGIGACQNLDQQKLFHAHE